MSDDAAPDFDERLDRFLGELRDQGFGVGVGERVAVAELLASLRVGGWDGAPRELSEWIAPIVCRSRAEQETFAKKFVEHFAGDTPRSTTEHAPMSERVVARQWAWWVAAAGLVLAVVAGVLIWIRPWPIPPKHDPVPAVVPDHGDTDHGPQPPPQPPPAKDVASYEVASWSRGFGPTICARHDAAVNSAVFSKDGSQVLTASDDKTARLWSLEGTQVVAFRGHTDNVHSAAFNPDGSRVLTSSGDKTARLWNVDGREIVAFRGHSEGVNSAVLSRDGTRVLTASSDYTARIWDLEARETATLRGHHGEVNGAVFAPDGARVLTSSTDTTVRVWDVAGKQISTFDGRGYQFWSAVFSPDGSRILTSSFDTFARTWTLDGKELGAISDPGHRLIRADFSPDGVRILTASGDSIARLWDRDGTEVAEFRGHEGPVRCVACSSDGSRLLTASDDGTARLWDVPTHFPVATLRGHADIVNRVAVSPDGERIATASTDHTVRVWDRAGKEVRVIDGPKDIVWSVAFSPDGHTLATASSDKTAAVWALDGSWMVELKGHTDVVRSAAFSPDGLHVVTASADKSARIWDLSGMGREIHALGGHEDAVVDAAYSPDGKRIVTASHDATARIWNADDGTELTKLVGHESGVLSAVFSPDGRRVLTSSIDRTARIWSVSGESLAILRGHEGPIDRAVFSPDGERILTASDDGACVLWEEGATGWRPVEMLQRYGEPVLDACFDREGHRVVTACADHVARVWNVSPRGTILRAWPWLVAGVAVLGAAWWALRSSFGALALRRRPVDVDTRFARIGLGTKNVELMDRLELREQAVRLRARATVESTRSDDIDVERTIERTSEAGGLLTVAPARYRETPAYLALVERTSPRDHLAQHADHRIDRLQREENVLVERGSFLGDPAVVASSGPRPKLWRIDELHARFRDRRVWVVGDYAATGGGAGSWEDEIAEWAHRSVLVPDGRAVPRAVRERLAAGGVRLAESRTPANVVGGGESPTQRAAPSAPFPPSIAFDPDRWLSPTPPDARRVDAMIAELRAYLGADGFRWCAACAVYPELHYGLTIDLGCLVLGRDRVDESAFLRLAGLPWFRHGAMPDWLRESLLAELPQATARSVRDHFIRHLTTDDADDVLDLPLAVDARGPLANVWHALTGQGRSDGDAPRGLRDAVFVDWMDDRVLSLALPRRLVRDLLRRTRPGTGPEHPRSVVLAGACSLTAGGLTAWLLADAGLVGLMPIAVLPVWVYAALVVAEVQFHRGARAFGAQVFEVMCLVVGAEAVGLFVRPELSGWFSAPTFFVATAVGVWIGRRPRAASALGRLADRVLLDRLVSWFGRDFSAGQTAPVAAGVRPRAVAMTGTWMFAGAVTWAAWSVEWRIGAEEWVWTVAALLLAGTLATALLCESRRADAQSPARVTTELFVACVAVLGVSAATSPDSVRWGTGLFVSFVVAVAGQLVLRAITSLRRRRHPAYAVFAALEGAASVVAPGAWLARFVPDTVERVEATTASPVRGAST